MFAPSKSVHQIDYAKFIYLHPTTKASSGRAVYIDPSLLSRFIELVDISSSSGLEIARGLTALKNTAAGTATSDSNQSNAFQHRSTIGNVVAYYTILQSGARGAGVYITDLRFGFSSGTDKPGLYKAERNLGAGTRWVASKSENQELTSLIGALGGTPPDANGSSDVNHTADTLANGCLSRERRSLGQGFSLFYTPSYAIDGMGVWLTSQQKTTLNHVSNLPREFAQILANTEKKQQQNFVVKERFKWYIVGQGAKVFQEALREYKRVSRTPLNKSHDFYFVDPQIPISELQQDLRENGIDFNHDKNILSETMSTASKVNQLFDSKSTYFGLHRTWTKEQEINKGIKAADNVLSVRNPREVCFSEIVQKLSSALSGAWG